ncbi:transglutaminase family protein [Pararhizobium gei]|uniref:transglutaminase family protein n=1 Tax=Pararhizobium gei TaxID=1395951 RepID=UPI0023DC117B|nr:transglutaminase family protein [Rhizobium gei]
MVEGHGASHEDIGHRRSADLPVAAAFAQSVNDQAAPLQAQTEALFAEDRDLLDVKLAVDRMVDPSTNVQAVESMIDGMADDVQAMAGETATGREKLAALKRYLYEGGPWNGNRPFRYDLDDPLGEKPANRLLQRYLTTRRGNCITMPMLMLFIGQRLGLTMTLAEAPLHVFIKYTDDDGATWNLEATSGGGFTRDIWYRQKLPMSDKAVENGVYLRPLPPQEAKALIAVFLVEHELATGGFENAVAVSDVLLRHYPTFTYALAKRGTAYQRLLKRDIISKYTRMEDIPPDLKAKADDWYQLNMQAFARAEALGWRQEDGQPK